MSSEQFLPTPKQWAAFACPADDVFFGGAAGGGKTRFDFEVANYICEEYPQARVAIFRRTTNELRYLKDKAREFLDPNRTRINENTGVIHYHNGSVVHLNHAHRKADIEKALTEEYAVIIFDEAGTFLPYQIGYARTRNRTPVRHPLTGEPMKPFLVLTSNPLGAGMRLLLKDFVDIDGDLVDDIIAYFPWWKARDLERRISSIYDPTNPRESDDFKKAWISGAQEEGIGWTVWKPGEREEMVQAGKVGKLPEPGLKSHDDVEYFEVWRPKPSELHRMMGLSSEAVRTRAYIPSWLQDNYSLPYEEYASNLASNEKLSEDVREALLLGSWDVLEGQFFKEFKPEKDGKGWHVVDAHEIWAENDGEPEDWWYHWGSMDWGYSAEAKLVFHLHCYDPDRQQRITYDEVAVSEMSDEEVSTLILQKISNRPVRQIFADPSMWKLGGGTTKQADTYLKAGVPLTKANNQRIPGWAAVRTAMATNPQTGRPNWCCTTNCRYLIETIPMLMYDENKEEDLDGDGPDHAADSLRYGMMGAPLHRIDPPVKKAPSLGRFVNRVAR